VPKKARWRIWGSSLLGWCGWSEGCIKGEIGAKLTAVFGQLNLKELKKILKFNLIAPLAVSFLFPCADESDFKCLRYLLGLIYFEFVAIEVK